MIFSIEDTFTSLALDESNFLTKDTQMVSPAHLAWYLEY